MLIVLIFLSLLIIFDIAAMRWGFTSSDGPDSKEWERRWQYAWLRECMRASSEKYTTEKYWRNVTSDVNKPCISCVGEG